jgi:hypothetical protein
MKTENRTSRLSLICEENWLNLEWRLPLRPLGRNLALIVLAAVTAWGGPELLRFVQMLLGPG